MTRMRVEAVLRMDIIVDLENDYDLEDAYLELFHGRLGLRAPPAVGVIPFDLLEYETVSMDLVSRDEPDGLAINTEEITWGSEDG